MIQCDGCGAVLHSDKCEYCGTEYLAIDLYYKRELANQNVSTINFLLSILKNKKDDTVRWLKVSGTNPIPLCEGVTPLPKNTQVEWVGRAEDYQKPFKQKNGQNIIIDDLKKDMNSRDKIKWASQLLNDPRKYV